MHSCGTVYRRNNTVWGIWLASENIKYWYYW
nr:MAG TPA: hypothetical protein [Bacteriophage sp.]